MDTEFARRQMIDHQVRAWDVLNARVLDVLARVPRERFVPPPYRKVAFADITIPLAHGQQMMTPTVEGRMLQALDVQPGDAVLEIGTGSGYTAACLAGMGGTVTSLDVYADFVDSAADVMDALGIDGVTLQNRDGSRLDQEGRYQAIAVTGSLPSPEPSFKRALAVGGRLFLIVGEAPVMEARLVTRVAADQWFTESLFETSLPPLQNVSQPSA
ncbi:MAG: protein-L-isoaspartate O-methyltransferase, partial [Pseudomonadota bacterium]